MPSAYRADIIGSFSESETLKGTDQVDLIGQGKYDAVAGTAHLGILASPDTWRFTLDFLMNPSPRR